MKYKNIYTAILVITGALVLTRCYWLLKSFTSSGMFFYSFPVFMQHLTTLIALAGVIIFGATKFKRAELLCLYFSIVILAAPISLLYYKTALSDARAYRPGALVYLSIALECISFVTACVGLWILTRQKRLKLHYIFIGQEAIAEFAPASRWKRFINYLVDSGLIIYSVYLYASILKYVSAVSDDHYSFSRSIAYSQWIPLFFYMIYYLVFEGVFKTTAGKAVTNTLIVNADGIRPGFGQMLGRTICRFIPFDGLSFFKADRRGWHDSVSETYVVDASLSQEPPPPPAPGDLLSEIEH